MTELSIDYAKKSVEANSRKYHFSRDSYDDDDYNEDLTLEYCMDLDKDINSGCYAEYLSCQSMVFRNHILNKPPFDPECVDLDIPEPTICNDQDYLRYKVSRDQCHYIYYCCALNVCNDDNGVIPDLIDKYCMPMS